ncbi:DNA/RNA helicase, superfamily I [Aciduliprofundum sp. MAR08-339]|uniref:ATP-dependent DNA helicase n=1 Tax=Aciduliprofundum sp. (strain MAR08-339) TaxID=673860 RepID=UPI0002A49EC3|nr:DNA/RNA helicase, superfamily I [Aciduliprofundum sp. MAR08-339]
MVNEICSDEIYNMIINGPFQNSPLSPAQKSAVESSAKHIRILAGAGAGKTETLTRRILYLLLCKNVEPDTIVAFTFTEKAAQSMKSRIYSRIIDIKGEEYAHKLGKMYIGTIHSYALRILQDYFGYGNYDVMDDKQEMAFVMKRGWGIGVNKLRGQNYGDKCKKFLEAVNVVYDEIIPRDKLSKKNPEFYHVFEKYESTLDEYHKLTFGRLIYLAVKNIKENPERLPMVKYLIVDEYQDINHAQEELIKLVGKNASIMVVGDPRQTIYQWRGSDDECFERFTEIYPDAETIVIPENRRSTKRIVEVGNKIANRFEKRKFDEMTPVKDEDGHVYVAKAKTPKEEAKWIVDQIENLVSEKNMRYSDFGILLRSVTTSGDPIIQELKSRDIPYIVGGTIGLFRREEALALGKLFCWLWDEGFWYDYHGKVENEELLDSALNDWISATKLLDLDEKDQVKEKLEIWREDVLNGKYHNFQEVYHEVLNILKFKDLEPSNKLHAAIMANLGRFSVLLGDYENAVRLGGNKLKWNNSLLKGLIWYIITYASTAYEEQPSEDIRAVDAVQVTTIHQAKGLEWHVVFIPSLVSRRFPSSHIAEKRMWLIDRDLFPARRYDTKMEDERRLFYVAATRAKSTLVLSFFEKYNVKKATISCFLREVLEDNPRNLEILRAEDKFKIDTDSPSVVTGEIEVSTFEAGEIVDYVKCPYFYRLRHVWNYQAPLAEELGYGNALHYSLRRAVELHKEGYNPLSAILEAVDKGFYLPYAPKYKAQKLKKSAENILVNYVADHMEDISSVAEVEYRLEFPSKNSTIAGKVDVIIDKGDVVEVREYKTSTKVTKPEHVALQVRLYALGLKGLGYNVGRGSVVYLGEGEIDEIDVSQDTLRNAKIYTENLLSQIQNQNYNPNPGDFCENCDYRDICKFRMGDEGE